MRAALFSIGAQQTGEYSNLKAYIDNQFQQVDEKAALTDFAGLKEAMQAIAIALKECRLLVFLLPLSDFYKNKILLMKLFRLEGQVSEEAVKSLEETRGFALLAEAEKKAAVVFPKNSKLIAPSSGVYTGFAVSSGKQEIAVLPFAEGLTHEYVEAYLISKGLIDKQPEIAEPEKPAEDKPQAPVMPEKSAEDTMPAPRTEVTEKVRLVSPFPKLEEYLTENDIKVGIASTPTSIFIKSAGEKLNCFEDAFRFIPYIRERNTYDLREYAVNLASLASEMAEAPFGVSITNVHTEGEGDEQERFVFIAAAGEKYAKAVKLYALPEEDSEAFLSTAADELLKLLEGMLAEYLGDFDYPRTDYQTPPRPVQFISGAKSLIVIGIVTAALIISFITGVLTILNDGTENPIVVSHEDDSDNTTTEAV